MKFPIILLIFLKLLSSNICFAQKEANIWYFGNHSGLDFNTEPPTILKDNKFYTSEGSGSIADSTGKLLFYSQGDTIWNKEHKIMENGTGLSHSFSNSSPSAAILVRQPLGKKYYIFNSGQRVYPSSDVFYSIIDMEANNGNGKVIVKRRLLVSKSAEKIALVNHANKRDIWIAIKQGYSDTLFVFLLTPAGISTSVLKYKTYLDSGATGQMKFSPNAKYLALGNIGNQSKDSSCYLYNFDNITGTISNQRKIHVRSYCIEFSPNSKYLYCQAGYGKPGLRQYPIKNIKTDFWPDSTCFYFNLKIGAVNFLQLAPNGKIYGNNFDTFLRVINLPNQKGVNCNYQNMGQKFLDTTKSFYQNYRSVGLPSFMSSYLRPTSFSYTSRCINEPTRFLLLDSLDNDSVKWIFGDTASHSNNFSNKATNVSHIYKSYGIYTASVVLYYDGRADTNTMVVNFSNLKPDFSAKDVCNKDSVRFSNKSPKTIDSINYNWKFGDGQYSNQASPNHLYKTDNISKTYNVTLTATALNGCKDSIYKPVTINANPGSDFNFTSNQTKVDFKATESGNTGYKWFFGNEDSSSVKDVIYTYPKAGKYSACLNVINAAGCFSKTCKDVAITAGLLKYKQNLGFTIYPNPNDGAFEIRMENPSKEIMIEVYNPIGNLIAQANDNSKIHTFNLQLASGIYLVKITDKNSIYYQKVIVNSK